VFAHLIHVYWKRDHDLFAAVREAAAELQGAYAIAVMSEKSPEALVVARKGAPLLIGLGKGENFAASDASALLQVTKKMIYLEEGDVAQIGTGNVQIRDSSGNEVVRPVHESQLSADSV